MVTLYDRDAAAVAAVLQLVVVLRRASPGNEYGEAAQALRNWEPTDIVEAVAQRNPALIDGRLKSIVAAIEEQLAT